MPTAQAELIRLQRNIATMGDDKALENHRATRHRKAVSVYEKEDDHAIDKIRIEADPFDFSCRAGRRAEASRMSTKLLPLESISARILVLRKQKVLLDSDLAKLYGVETRRLNEQVKRNRERFPQDFISELGADEFRNLKSQFATSSWGGRRKLPLAFTEHGAIMAATILNSPRAVEVSVYVVRAFVQLRELAVTHRDLARRLAELEEKTEALALQQDSLAHNTRVQLKQVFEAIRQLMTPPDPPRRPIGFVIEKDDKRNKNATKGRNQKPKGSE